MFHRRKSPPPRQAAPGNREAAQGPESEVHRSLAFPALLSGLERGRKVTVLDLGPALEENVRFFAGRSCTLYIEDLRRAILGSLGGRALDPGQVLADAGEVRFDAVIAWDLFDYLDDATTAAVVATVRERCRPGALLFALAGYLAQIPDRPHRFKVLDAETLLYGERSPYHRPSPRRNAREMDRLLQGFSMETSYLLRHGWQEFLYVRRG